MTHEITGRPMEVTVEVGPEQEAKKGAWAKCSGCGHCWIVAYYPMNLEKFAKLMKKHSDCPKCGEPGMIAKQQDGVLNEPRM